MNTPEKSDEWFVKQINNGDWIIGTKDASIGVIYSGTSAEPFKAHIGAEEAKRLAHLVSAVREMRKACEAMELMIPTLSAGTYRQHFKGLAALVRAALAKADG